jgi:DNA-binding XRE family transcriptional regulator
MARTAPNIDLQRERFRQQMSRTALAHRTHLSRKCLLDIELGRTRPRMDTAARIAQALNVDVSDLFREVIG